LHHGRFISTRPSLLVSGPRFLDAIFIIAAIGCLGAGLALAGFCDGGDSLILFGGAVALVGALLFRSGAWDTVIARAIVTLTVVAGGW